MEVLKDSQQVVVQLGSKEAEAIKSTVASVTDKISKILV